MKIEIWWIGKTKDKYLTKGIDEYLSRIKHYNQVKAFTIRNIRKTQGAKDLRDKEGIAVLEKLTNRDYLVLLDEKGALVTSVQFSKKLENWQMDPGIKRLVFLVAGAYGASEQIKERANFSLSLSRMTFSHQMVRLFLLEQIYRAFTIIRNEKYHNP